MRGKLVSQVDMGGWFAAVLPGVFGRCGQISLYHALLLLGVAVDPLDVKAAFQARRWAGTTDDQIIRVARHYGLQARCFQLQQRNEVGAWTWLEKTVGSGVAVLGVKKGSHWVLAYKITSRSTWVIDPNCGRREPWGKVRLLNAWWDGTGDGYLGIKLQRRKARIPKRAGRT